MSYFVPKVGKSGMYLASKHPCILITIIFSTQDTLTIIFRWNNLKVLHICDVFMKFQEIWTHVFRKCWRHQNYDVTGFFFCSKMFVIHQPNILQSFNSGTFFLRKIPGGGHIWPPPIAYGTPKEAIANRVKGELQPKVSAIIFSNSHQELKKSWCLQKTGG